MGIIAPPEEVRTYVRSRDRERRERERSALVSLSRRGEVEGKEKKVKKRSLAFLLVLAGDLRLAVGPQPRHGAVLADLGELEAELRGEDVGEGHELGGLVGGVAVFFFFLRVSLCLFSAGGAEIRKSKKKRETLPLFSPKHVTLVSRADLLERLGAEAVHALADVRGLLLEPHEHLALVRVEADVVRDKADVAGRLAHDGLVVDLGLGRDLAEDHDHVGLGRGLARDLERGVGVWDREEEEKKR